MFKKYFIYASRVVFLLLVVSNVVLCDKLKIYENLVQCYRQNNTNPTIGNSFQILLEIIRKIENKYPTALDIRTLSVSILHRLRIDGIERAPGIQETDVLTPYRPNGHQTSKFQLLLKLISDVPGLIQFEDVLTPLELCTLHKLVSSSIEPFSRGDESRTCSWDTKDGNNFRESISEFIQRTKVKVYQTGKTYVVPASVSKCPIEMGVMRTFQYGSLSPGVVITAIAAGLQPQLVTIKEFFPSIETESSRYTNLETMEESDTEQIIRKLSQSLDILDNTYAAGLAGDLAEVCVYQAPYFKTNVSVGLPGHWNDTEFPLIRYLQESYQLQWAMTDSEILAGIDSFHLSTHIRSWVNRIRRMRLSQILEMYYSPRGIPTFAIENSNRYKKPIFPDSSQHDWPVMSLKNEERARIINLQRKRPSSDYKSQFYGAPDESSGGVQRGIHYDTDRYTIGDNIDSACERKQILSRISKDRLKEQTYFFAQVLQYSSNSLIVDDSLIKDVCDSAVDTFFDYATKLLDKLPDCSKIGSNYLRATVDLTLIIDGSRTKFENLKLISFLSELIDVSCYGSKISVVHGTTGEFLVKPTDSILNAFDQLWNFKDPYPTTLSLTESFTTIVNSMSRREEEKRENHQIAGNSKVILVVSQSQKIRENDFNGAKRMLEGTFQEFTDLYFVFLTNDVRTFEEMIAQAAAASLNSSMLFNIINAPNTDPKTFSSSLSKHLRSIPKWMRIPNCQEMVKPSRNPGDVIPSQHRLQHEEYISPNEKIFYRIDGRSLLNVSELQVQFEGADYGDITACMTLNSKDYQCQSTHVTDPVQFNITGASNYPSLTFRIDMDNSKMKCSETDCRYPDQVRFLVRLRDTNCANTATHFVISSVLFMFVLLRQIYVLLR